MKELKYESDNIGKKFSKQVEALCRENIETYVEPIRHDMEVLMAARSKWKSDDMLKQQRVLTRVDTIEADYFSMKEYIETTLSPLSVCLLENMNC